MHRSSFTEHGLLIAVACLASLALAPTALANDSAPVASDPAAMAMALADATLAGMPPFDAATVAGGLNQALAPVVQAPATQPAPAAAPEAVPAAAAEPNPAMEPHPTPPPPPAQPDVPSPVEATAELAPISAAAVPESAPSVPAAPVGEPQYQSESPQYQPAQAAPAAPAPLPAAAPAEQDWNWDWTFSCGGSKPPTEPPAVPGGGLPKNWNWNWDWNCGPGSAAAQNSDKESGPQYQPTNTRYQPLNVNVTIRIASPGDNGPVTQTNVVFAVGAGPASATVQAAVPALGITPASSAPLEASAPAAPAAATPAEVPEQARAAKKTAPPAKNKFASDDHERAPFAAQPVVAEAPSWTARPVVSRRLQPAQAEAHRGRPQLRRPTRRPLPPRRAPAIPVGSGGASPLGGSDGGGFHVALLLVPFAFALVDSARRSVRDITPPMGRAHRSRQERPG